MKTLELEKVQEIIGGDDPFVSVAQAARRSRVPLSTLSDAIRRKRIHALVMPDKRRYVRLSAVMTYVQDRKKQKRNGPRAGDALLAIAKMAQEPGLRDTLPPDFGKQHDHYLYGLPKRR